MNYEEQSKTIQYINNLRNVIDIMKNVACSYMYPYEVVPTWSPFVSTKLTITNSYMYSDEVLPSLYTLFLQSGVNDEILKLVFTEYEYEYIKKYFQATEV